MHAHKALTRASVTGAAAKSLSSSSDRCPWFVPPERRRQGVPEVRAGEAAAGAPLPRVPPLHPAHGERSGLRSAHGDPAQHWAPPCMDCLPGAVPLQSCSKAVSVMIEKRAAAQPKSPAAFISSMLLTPLADVRGCARWAGLCMS
jgi:hypothetical protein